MREVEEVVGRSLGLRQAMEEAVEEEERTGRVRRASEVRKLKANAQVHQCIVM